MPSLPETPAAADEQPSSVQSVLSVLTTLGPPLTMVTALMLYFGWARSDKQAKSMGLDVSLFGYSAQDYVLRSVTTLFIPLLAAGGLALGWLALHRRLVARVHAGDRRLRTVGTTAFGVGLVGVGCALAVTAVDRTWVPLLPPLVIALGTATAVYGRWLADAASGERRVEVVAVWQKVLRALVIGTVISLALFWELKNYADVVGRGYAVQIAGSVTALPRATAISEHPLGIVAPGVKVERFEDGGKTYYRTTGLRLLVQSGGHLFLLHDGWAPGGGTVVVLADDKAVRWQFSR
ncbi:hypothetical protein [Saccharothrix deserti]|uniref:hypothetical protein n=1 Tax=Saccharothrix deserti TaxID=2593674 RepID=UPI00131BEEAA|nr:hypothetical protein [Saccharothrix deserti]